MTPYAVYEPSTGRIVRVGWCAPDMVPSQPRLDHDEAVLIGEARPGTHFVRDGALVAYTPDQLEARNLQPNHLAVWCNTAMCWQDGRDLAQRLADKLAELKAARDTAIYGGFTWSNSRFDSDEISQTRLLGATVRGVGETWRLADNTWRVLSAADLNAVYAALANHVRQQFITFAGLEAQARAATDTTTLEGITWPATS